MFERPTEGDPDRSLSLVMHQARHEPLDEVNRIKAEAARVGALQGTRVIITAVNAANTMRSALFPFPASA